MNKRIRKKCLKRDQDEVKQVENIMAQLGITAEQVWAKVAEISGETVEQAIARVTAQDAARRARYSRGLK